MNSKSTKAQKMFHVSACVLVLEMQKGHLAWKVTELVRKSGVSRALIYRYFGSSREKMLREALRVFVDHFYGFEPQPKAEPLAVMVGRARQYIIDYPETALFYQKFRQGDSEIAKEFMRIEEKFQKKLMSGFPHLSLDRILYLRSCIHGMVTSPFLSSKEATEACEKLIAEMND